MGGSRGILGGLCAVVLAGLALGAGTGAPAAAPEGGERAGERAQFRGSVERLSPKLRRRMRGVSWHEGCPVGLGKLRLLRVSHWDFKRRPERGRLVVHERSARGMVKVFKRLWAKRFRVRRIELIDRYRGSDHASMDADNTSAFNCRVVAGTSRWSMHAYGKAVDINPRENPYVSGDHVSPPAGRPYADRRPRRKGMIFRKGPVTRSMKRIIGWQWGGAWKGTKDYQHFSSDGN